MPIYQRHYVWTRAKQWEPFWNEVRSKSIERLAGRERRFAHFMGAVVLEARGGYTAARIPTFQVVDGQQRLTTFQLFLAAARNYARSRGFGTTAEKISTYMLNDKPHLMEEPEVEVYKVWPTQFDRELVIDILSLNADQLREKYSRHYYAKRDQVHPFTTVPNPLGAYGYFMDRIRHAVETDDLDDEYFDVPEAADADNKEQLDSSRQAEFKLDAMWQSLVEEFKIVEIVLEDGDDAQVIFETLNERGEPLLAADLVRNNIFQRADAAHEKPENLFETYWKPFEDSFWTEKDKQGRYKKERIEFFLGNYIAGQIAGEVTISKLFSEYKAFYKKRKFATVKTEIQELQRYGRIYRILIERTGVDDLSKFARQLNPWDVTTAFPLAMRIWGDDRLAERDKRRCLDLLITFIVRRAVCGLTTKNYNKLFLSVVSHCDAHGWHWATFREFLVSQTAETGRLPNDREFEQRWLDAPSYVALQPSRARTILESIEREKRNKYHETTELASALTVEHVLPRQWASAWPLAGGVVPSQQQLTDALFYGKQDESVVGQIVKRNKLKESFGNLTLLTKPLNSSVSNGPFVGKKEALEKHSLLVLNREIVAYSDWDEDAIVTRGRDLFKVALKLWSYPDVVE